MWQWAVVGKKGVLVEEVRHDYCCRPGWCTPYFASRMPRRKWELEQEEVRGPGTEVLGFWASQTWDLPVVWRYTRGSGEMGGEFDGEEAVEFGVCYHLGGVRICFPKKLVIGMGKKKDACGVS